MAGDLNPIEFFIDDELVVVDSVDYWNKIKRKMELITILQICSSSEFDSDWRLLATEELKYRFWMEVKSYCDDDSLALMSLDERYDKSLRDLILVEIFSRNCLGKN